MVVVAGIYLASARHYLGEFCVQWSLGVALVIAPSGGFLLPRKQRLAELAADERSSDDYQSLAKQVGIAGSLLSLLVLITRGRGGAARCCSARRSRCAVFVMTAKPFSEG